MKTNLPSSLRLSLACVIFGVTSVIVSAQVTDWYLVQGNTSDQNWNSTNSSQSYKYWADSASIINYTGLESHYASSMDSAATYHVIGTASTTKDVRTGTSSNNFAGGKLILENQYSRLLIRSTGANISTIANLESKGGQFSTAMANVNNLTIGTFTVTGEVATRMTATSGSTNRTHNLSIGTLVGDGDIAFSSDEATSKYTFSIGNASAYTGSFLLTVGELTFTSSLQTAGSLILTSGTFNLTNDITVAALSVSGTALGAGSYSVSDLAPLAGSNLTIKGNASITVSAVPEPAQTALLLLLAAAGAVFAARYRKA